MINELLYKLGVKEKPRHEKIKDSFTEAVHTVADALDEMVATGRAEAPKVAKEAKKQAREVAEKAKQEAPKAAKKTREQAKQAAEEASHLADAARAQASELADTLREQTAEQREQAAEAIAEGRDKASQKRAAMLAALGALTADWEEITQSLVEELSKRTPSTEEVSEKAAAAKKEARKAATPKKKRRGFPGFWVWLLRLGIGYQYIENLRDLNYAAYINQTAYERMRRASEGHPVKAYKDILDNTLIPNASLVAIVEVIGSALVALSYITGLNRRLGALLGLLITGNNFMLDYNDHEKRGQHLVLLLSQLLLLRTGG